MKRSHALVLIANQLEFLQGNFEGFKLKFTEKQVNAADVILTTLENAGMKLVDDYNEATSWEPEEGWDKYFEEQEKRESVRDFKVTGTSRKDNMAQAFLDGDSFQEIALYYNVTVERVRQCVWKVRRKYQKENSV